MVENQANDKNFTLENNFVNKRLPCRGCMVDCKNYGRCNGKLWRMNDSIAAESKK